jgi:F-box interacting protein
VCNPATEKWVDVPATEWSREAQARIGFDPSVSSHFHVFEFIDEEGWGIAEEEQHDCFNRIEALAMYSSKAGGWKHQNLDGFEFAVFYDSRSAFFNGILHVATSEGFILAIDVEGNDRGLVTIPMPPYNDDVFVDDIFLSQRQLCTACIDRSQLTVWVLEDYKSEKWTLKHNASLLELFGEGYRGTVISFHPERNMIFIVCGHENTLMSYDMDCRKMCSICQLERDCQPKRVKTPFLPYVPLYSEPLADGN